MRLARQQSLLLIVDLQTRLLPVVEGGQQIVEEATWLGELASQLEVPVWLTEQYPEGLGESDPGLLAALPQARRWTKMHFGAYDEPAFARGLAETGRSQVVICGAEAHVCVMQTALGLLAAGYRVYWLVEATASRRRGEAELAMARVRDAGGVAVSADMVAYEWLRRCDGERFKRAHRHFLKPRSARPLTF